MNPLIMIGYMMIRSEDLVPFRVEVLPDGQRFLGVQVSSHMLVLPGFVLIDDWHLVLWDFEWWWHCPLHQLFLH